MKYSQFSFAVILTGLLGLSPVYAMDGVCVDSPQTDCSLYYNPPSTGGGYTGGTTYYPPRKSAAEIEAEMNRENANAFNRAGNRHYEKGRYAEAIKDYEMALRFDPGNATLKENLRDARRALAEMQATKSNNSGNAAYKAGNLEEAVKHYRTAHRNAPNDPVIKENLANAEREWNQQKEEKRQIREADSEIQKGIDDLRDSIADTPPKQGKSAKSGTKARPFGIEADHEADTLRFMSAEDKPVNTKTRSGLEAAATSGKAAGGLGQKGGYQAEVKEKTLSFMDPAAEKTKREAGRPFDEGIGHDRVIAPVQLKGMSRHELTPLQKEIASLSPDDRSRLEQTPGFQQLRKDWEENEKSRQGVEQKIEDNKKLLESATGSKLKKLEREQSGLEEKKAELAKSQGKIEEKISKEVKKLNFHEEEIGTESEDGGTEGEDGLKSASDKAETGTEDKETTQP